MIATSPIADVTMHPRSAVVGDLERAWDALGPKSGTALLIDLSTAKYADVPGLLYLLSRVTERLRKGIGTWLRLPVDPSVVGVLRAWQFDLAVERICGTAFESLLDGASRELWARVADQPRSANDELLPASYYPIQLALRASRDFGPSLARDWSENWRSAYVLSVLDKMLAGNGRHVATHIIHEAVMNGVRHPGAQALATASSTRTYREGRTSKPKSRHLTICVWDDGESIVSTLRRLIPSVATLTPRKSSLFLREIQLERWRLDSSAPERSTLTNQQSIPTGADDAMLLLASTFPGVTSDLAAERGFAHPDLVRRVPEFALPGMGLYVLATTVAEVFGGKATIRCENLRMSIDKAPSQEPEHNALHVKISELPPTSRLLGNQLTLRIPRHALATE